MLSYDYGNYVFKAYDEHEKVCDVRYLDVTSYGYDEGHGIRVETKDNHHYVVKNYWFDYAKSDCDDKFKFECFERDVYRLLFLSEWSADREAFIDKHYMTLEKFEKIKEQKQNMLDEYVKCKGNDLENDFEYRSLQSAFALLRHKPRSEVANELTEMGNEFLGEMSYFDKMKKAQTLFVFEQNALELYGEPVDFEESQIDDMADIPFNTVE